MEIHDSCIEIDHMKK